MEAGRIGGLGKQRRGTGGILPAAARNLDAPFPVSPSGGKPGRAGSPHAGSTLRASKKRCHASMLPAPPTRGISKRFAEIPLVHPPVCLRQQGILYGLRQQGTLSFFSRVALDREGPLMEAATVRERFAPVCARRVLTRVLHAGIPSCRTYARITRITARLRG